MRQISINTICTLSVTAAVVAVITVLVIYVSTSSYHMVAGVQTEALNEASKTVARSAEIYIQQSVDVATILSRQEPVLKALCRSAPGSAGIIDKLCQILARILVFSAF